MSSSRVVSCLFRLAAGGACLLLVAAAAACGGGGKETPASTTTVQPLSTPGASTPEAVATVDPEMPLVEYHPPDGGYFISYPEGWQVEPTSGSTLAAFSWMSGGKPLAQLTVLCNEGENNDADTLIGQDLAGVAKLGSVSAPVRAPIEIGGVAGVQITYTIDFGEGFTVDQVAAYVVEGGCGWRIGLAAYTAGTLESYQPLFERIIASFRVD